MSKISILAFDIETLPQFGPFWTRFRPIIRQESIIEHTSIFCACWQVVDHNGRPKGAVQSSSILDDPKRFKANIYDDEHVVRELHKAAQEADMYLFQNGISFDLKKLNARIVYYGLEPLPEKQSIDTLRKARQTFGFDSNKLDYMGRYLGVGEKMETGGQQMWDDITQCKYPPVGKEPDFTLTEKTIKYAVKYCKQDVKLLIEVYKKIRPYIKLPVFSTYLNKLGCIHCGGQEFRKHGFRYTAGGKRHPRYFCRPCNKPFDPPRTQGKWIDGQFEHA